MTDGWVTEEDILDLDRLAREWPNCTTPDCPNKQCTWSGLTLCHPCAVRAIGEGEMVQRFNATHDITWDEATRLTESDDDERRYE
jgi:hypothetical protein